MNRRLLLPACTAALLALSAGRAAPPVGADEIQLADGSVIEAEILREFRDREGEVVRYEVRTLEGRRSIAVGDIRRRVPRTTLWQAFEDDYYSIDAGDADDFWRLGQWARDRGLAEEARRAFESVVRADPDHVGARKALGHLRVGGKWVIPENLRRGPEDCGRPVRTDDASRLEAVLGVALAKRETDDDRLESTHLGQRALGRYLDTLTRAREAALSLLGEAPPAGRAQPTYLLVADDAEYQRAIDLLIVPSLEAKDAPDGAARQLRLFRAGHLAMLQAPRSGCIVRPVEENEIANRAFLAHYVVHEVWSAAVPSGTRLPDWLREAFAYRVLREPFPDDPTYCVATGSTGRATSPPDSWRNTRTWPGRARRMAAENKALPFEDLARLDLNSLSFEALIQAWSVLDVLLAENPEGTRAFLRRVHRGEEQMRALKESLGLDPDGVDRLWRREMLKRR